MGVGFFSPTYSQAAAYQLVADLGSVGVKRPLQDELQWRPRAALGDDSVPSGEAATAATPLAASSSCHSSFSD